MPESAALAPSGRLSPRHAFALLASIMAGFMAASTAPSPLYALYREQWGFSALVPTLVFAVYAFSLLAGLLVFGKLSDHLGRRPVLIASLLLELGSILLFLRADSVGWLIAARLLQGLATGIASATVSAALLDIDGARGGLVNSVAPLAGMSAGTLGASALLQFAAEPTLPVFSLLFALLAAQTLACFYLPESTVPRPGALRSMRPQVAVPASAAVTMWRILPMNTALWALGGFYVSLGPSLARQVSGLQAPLVGGGFIATLMVAGAIAVLRYRMRPAAQVLAGSARVLVAGLLLTMWGVHAHAALALFVGTAISGLGFGAGFNASIRSLVPLAPPEQRGALMASFYVFSYLAFSLPTLVAGRAVAHVGLDAAALGYAGVLALLCALAAWRLRNTA